MNYDFSQLNDKEFEILVNDLLSMKFGNSIERFKSGKDGGVDGRFFLTNKKEVILQSKHYFRTGYKGLISKLVKEEQEKVSKLNPHRYIFITSLPLSRNNKKEIMAVFHPYIVSDDDVFGQEDLNDLLRDNPEIEERHYKLWISSTVVLNRIMNNAIRGRSEFEIEKIHKKSYRYVPTENYIKALNFLNENRVLIITGEPGIGKTTLAENICLYFSSKNYEFVDIEDSLRDAESIYIRGKKQIFYFDDFLGSNYFEAISNKKDSHIVKFIDRVKSDNTKLFILTSRTNILNSGVMHSSIFSNSNIQINEYMLTISTLTKMDKARILYNHIWFSELSDQFVDEIYKSKRYHNIIDHNNFNPRLVEFITDVARVGLSSSEGYWQYIEDTLRNPKEIWSSCFKIQNNAYVRNLVNLTVFNGGDISEYELREGFDRMVKFETLNNSSHTEKDFNSTSQLATKSFLRRNIIKDYVSYSLFNPSISDFIHNEYCQNVTKLSCIFRSLGTLQSLMKLDSLSKVDVLNNACIERLKSEVFDEMLNGNRSYDYQIYSSYMVRMDGSKRERLLSVMDGIIRKPAHLTEFSKFLWFLDCYSGDLKINSYSFICELISNRYLNEEEINDLSEFLALRRIDDEGINYELKMSIEYFVKDELNNRKLEVDLTGLVDSFSGSDGEPEFDYDSNLIEQELSVIEESVVEDLNITMLSSLEIELDSVVDEIDIDEMVNEYLSSQFEPDFGGFRDSAKDDGSEGKDIDELFDRS